MQRRLTTIVAADLAEYSRLMAIDEEGVIQRLRATRSDVIDPAVAEANGRIIKTMGDGILVEYPSPVEAVRSVISVQEQMVERETGSADQRLRFRVGINVGDVVEDGDDILGDGVNVAARLESLAPPGGICISRSVHDQLRGKIDVPMTELGQQMVKNIPEPVEVWRVEINGVNAPVQEEKTERPSIAVLPFDNMSSDPEQEFFADGIVEDVITELSRFRNLFVIARNSTFVYKGTATDIRQVARELGVRYVVEGSVRRGGDRVRLTAQLIEAETGSHVWADKWDRTLDDLFSVQDELTAAIVTAVEPELGAHERTLARKKPSESLTAWELCQRGISEQMKFTPEAIDIADTFFRKAIEIDSTFADPHVMLARNGWVRLGSGWSKNPASELKNAMGSVKRGLELDDRQEMAHLVLGVLLAIAGEPRDGSVSVNHALALNPNNVQCHYAMCMVNLFDNAIDGNLMHSSGQECLKLNPKDPRATMYHFFSALGRWVKNGLVPDDAYIAEMEAACRYTNAPWFVFMICAVGCVRMGFTDRATKHLSAALQRRPELTKENYRHAFLQPSWPDFYENDLDALETLVELGLPRD
ncbi:adenylate/guanylate cyclase domain-containing protein [Ruegeria atlantica]|uniref:adenylate/guanylate cyclase domain-containing protein n=1 Tax=Ruegeria atlantica TaxID=81569 RepID=UPI002493EADF|nr:adenylate/guanylate cyclase domain-containing protein [Ruegeria atlantica]